MPIETRPILAIAFAASTLLLSAAARADISPPPGWKETCTEELQKKPGQECHFCSAYFNKSDHCTKLLTSYAFAQTCRTRGGSVWSELWCRPTTPSAKALPPNVMAALTNPDDDGSDAGPTPTTTATATARTSATTGPTTTNTTNPSSMSSATETSSPRPPIDEAPKKGACGACVVGGGAIEEGAAETAGLAFGAIACALGLSRRRRRA